MPQGGVEWNAKGTFFFWWTGGLNAEYSWAADAGITWTAFARLSFEVSDVCGQRHASL